MKFSELLLLLSCIALLDPDDCVNITAPQPAFFQIFNLAIVLAAIISRIHVNAVPINWHFKTENITHSCRGRAWVSSHLILTDCGECYRLMFVCANCNVRRSYAFTM